MKFYKIFFFVGISFCSVSSAHSYFLIRPFTLTDESYQPYTQRQLKGHWSLLFFGFTHCHSICPTTMSQLSRVYRQWQIEKLNLPQVLFITLDPRRDTMEDLKNYVHAFHPDFKALHGNAQSLRSLKEQLGVVSLRTQDVGDYQIDHSGVLYLINPKGALVHTFSPPHDWTAIQHDYQKIVQGDFK